MRAVEIRNLTDTEILAKLDETYQELFNLRFQVTIGQAKDLNRIRTVKRDIARLKTVLRERQLEAAYTEAATAEA
jgi:large subunit ribosomal protein L29